jgi:hypothetical protein
MSAFGMLHTKEEPMKSYVAPTVTTRGDVLRETEALKPVYFMELRTRRYAPDANLSFGL